MMTGPLVGIIIAATSAYATLRCLSRALQPPKALGHDVEVSVPPEFADAQRLPEGATPAEPFPGKGSEWLAIERAAMLAWTGDIGQAESARALAGYDGLGPDHGPRRTA